MPGSLSLSVTSAPGGSSRVIGGTGPNSLRITKAEFVLAQTAVSQGPSCSPTTGGCDELAREPLLISLPLGGSSPARVLHAPVSAGSYRGLQADLHAVGPEAPFRAAHPDWPAGLSVRVVGVYTDPSGVARDFTFTSPVDARLQMTFVRPLRVDGNVQNVTLAVDVARWFTNGRGTVLDPRNSANAQTINDNIRNSFQAYQDDDEDGVADDGNDVEDDDTTEVEDDTTEADDDAEDDDAADVDSDTLDVEDDDQRTTEFSRAVLR